MADKEKGYKTRTYLEKDAPHLVETKAKLDKIGKGMCLAKWTQEIHLHYITPITKNNEEERC